MRASLGQISVCGSPEPVAGLASAAGVQLEPDADLPDTWHLGLDDGVGVLASDGRRHLGQGSGDIVADVLVEDSVVFVVVHFGSLARLA